MTLYKSNLINQLFRKNLYLSRILVIGTLCATVFGCSPGFSITGETSSGRQGDLVLREIMSASKSDSGDFFAICMTLREPGGNTDRTFTLNVPLKDRGRWEIKKIHTANKAQNTVIRFHPKLSDITPGCTTHKHVLTLFRIDQKEYWARIRKSESNQPVQLDNTLSDAAYVVTRYGSDSLAAGYVSKKQLIANGHRVEVLLNVHLRKPISECGKLLIVKEKAKNGQEVNAKDSEGWTALHCAARENDVVRTKWLLDRKALVDAKSSKDATPLMLAAAYGSADVARILVQSGADVNAVTRKGGTPLLAASRVGHAEVVRILLMHGADVHYTDALGYTAWKWANQNRHEEVKKLLEEHGCCDR